MKKRLLSLLLAVLMVAGMIPATVFTVLADETSVSELPKIPDDSYGELSITVKNTVATRETEFIATLTGKSTDKVYTTTFTSKANAEFANGFIVDGITKGTYTLEIIAPGYQTYTQNLEFDNDRIELILYNAHSVNDGRNADQTQFGVFAYGDVTGDGVINGLDSTAITQVMNNADPGKRNVAGVAANAQAKITTADCNLNGDKDASDFDIVDLADLTICVRNQQANVPASVVHAKSSIMLLQELDAKAETSEETTLTVTSALGSTTAITPEQALLSPSSDSVVTLGTKNADEDLSEGNAAEISLKVESPAITEGNEEEGVKEEKGTGAVVLRAPTDSDNKITNGTMEVEGLDADGQEVKIEASLTNSSAESKPAPAKVAKKTRAAISTYADTPAPAGSTTSVESDGTIVVNLGRQVAIKKISIKITGSSTGKLADIAKVEFLGDFNERVPEPQLSIPTVGDMTYTEADGLGYRSVTVNWTKEDNITGYEVKISGSDYNKTMTSTTEKATFVGDSFNGTVNSFNTYKVQVRSTNGEWKSPWSAEKELYINTEAYPKVPEYLSGTPNYGSASFSWRKLWDTQSWIFYYKVVENQDELVANKKLTTEAQLKDAKYIEVETSTNSLTRQFSGDAVLIDFCVVGVNKNGHSPVSNHGNIKTLADDIAVMPKYKTINTMTDTGRFDNHIESITYNSQGSGAAQYDVVSPNYKGKGFDPYALIDNNPNTYLKRGQWNNGLITVKLDQRVAVKQIRYAFSKKDWPNYISWSYGMGVSYTDENGQTQFTQCSWANKSDADGKKYCEVTFNDVVVSDTFIIKIVAYNFDEGNTMNMQELRLYYYDSLEDDVAAIFSDSMRTAVKEDITEDYVQKLLDRANTPDQVSGEYHPARTSLVNDLEYALKYLKDGSNDAELIEVDNLITWHSDKIGNGNNSMFDGFAQGLSDYQPTGYVAGAQDTIIVYVTRQSPSNLSKGADSDLYLIFTQYHPENTAWKAQVRLKAGRNEIQVPRVAQRTEERGGALYLNYSGGRGTDDYRVRIMGATKIPMLNVKGVEKDARADLIKQYVEDLQAYIYNDGKGISGMHVDLHDESVNDNVRYPYDVQNCFLNSTEISMNNMFYSVPATQVWAGLDGNLNDPMSANTDKMAEQLAAAVEAMEQEIDYFYQFKGLSASADASSRDRYPMQRLNIRYHRMFTGAFMYAASKHIGIEFGSVSGLFGMKPVLVDENGKVTESGSFGGWGIAHEIGHCINTSAYQRVEVTNNVYAQLEKAFNGGYANSNFRTSYENVYKGVASGTVGHNGNLAVQLAMYWQLHLAYDDSFYVGKVYNTAEEAQDNLIYAKIDSIYRTPSKVSGLTLNGDADQNFMRVVCAAAGKDLLDFFRAWGFTPNADTVNYAATFPHEDRLIQYVNDDSLLYRLEGKNAADATMVEAAITNTDNVTGKGQGDARRITGDRVNLKFKTDDTVGAILGYEIKRDGKVIAFVTPTDSNTDGNGYVTYTDVLTTENNKAFVYTVTAVDMHLNKIASLVLTEVKLSKDTNIAKDNWSLKSTNMISSTDTVLKAGTDENNSHLDITVTKVDYLFDGDNETIYSCDKTSSGRPNVTIDLGNVEQVSGITLHPVDPNSTRLSEDGKTYTNPDETVFSTSSSFTLSMLRVFGYTIQTSVDGNTWTTVKTGNVYPGCAANNPAKWKTDYDVTENKDGSLTLYFNKVLTDKNGKVMTDKDGKTMYDPFMYTYDARYISITSESMSLMALAEIDLHGPTSDNVELMSYGTLKSDYYYTEPAQENYKIPAGSYVFFGEYSGDPTYSAIMLRGKSDNEEYNKVILGGEQIILADVPEHGELGNVTTGTWIYWMPPGNDEDGNSYQEQLTKYGVTDIQAQLYRVDDALTLQGERMTSNSLHMNIDPDVLKTSIEITADKKTNTDASTQATNSVAEAQMMMAAEMGCEPTLALFSAASYSYSYGLAAIAEADEGSTDDASTNGSIVETNQPHAVNPFTYSVVMDENDALLAKLGGDMTFELTPATASFATQTTVKFEYAGLVDSQTTVQFDTDSVPPDVYVGYYVDRIDDEIHLYVISKQGALNHTDKITGKITNLAESIHNEVPFSVTVDEVNTDVQMYRGEDGKLIPTYQFDSYIEYEHTLEMYGDFHSTCTEAAEDIYRCIHYNETHKHEVKEENALLPHSYEFVDGVLQCSVCGIAYGKDEAALWDDGYWYLNGVQLKNGTVQENGGYYLYNMGVAAAPGVYRVENGVIIENDNVPFVEGSHKVVYVMNDEGLLATGDVKIAGNFSVSYTTAAGETKAFTFDNTSTHKFDIIGGAWLEQLDDGDEIPADVIAENTLKDAIRAYNTSGAIVPKAENETPANALAEYGFTTPKGLPSGVTYNGVSAAYTEDAVTLTFSFTVTTTAVKKYKITASKTGEGWQKKSTTSWNYVVKYDLNKPEKFNEAFDAITFSTWAIKDYCLLSYVYDVLSNSKSSENEVNLVQNLCDYYNVKTAAAKD